MVVGYYTLQKLTIVVLLAALTLDRLQHLPVFQLGTTKMGRIFIRLNVSNRYGAIDGSN